MDIVHQLTCAECKETYAGQFKVKLNGEIVCKDCEDKKKYQGLDINIMGESTVRSSKIVETYKKILLEDVETIYNNESEKNQNYTDIFYTKDGKIDTKKLMFYNNPVSLVLLGHTVALKSLKYLNSANTDKKYEKEAKEIIEKYKELRLRKITQQEADDMWLLFKSEESKNIANEVSK